MSTPRLSRVEAFQLIAESVATHNKPAMSTMSVMRGTRPTDAALTEIKQKLKDRGISVELKNQHTVGDLVETIVS